MTMSAMEGLTEYALEVLCPSWKEISISLGLVVVLLNLLWLASSLSNQRPDDREVKADAVVDTDSAAQQVIGSPPHNKVPLRGDAGSSSVYLVKLQLLAAKNLIAANLNGSSDPYAILTCGPQKRFSSMVPGTRNPMWGEEFDFYTEELPVQVNISIYDWDILWKSTHLGSVTLKITAEGDTEAVWHVLDKASGQVCVHTSTKCLPASTAGAVIGGIAGGGRGRRITVDRPVGTEVRQQPGPLQTIFGLPPDEVVEHSYSCAMERSFLYHGRMYVSTRHICFNSNVFGKHMKVVLYFEDVEEIRRSQHALINPAITIVLRAGSGGDGVPPLSSPDGRAKYKFASFWNRNHAHRVLLRTAKNFQAVEEAAKLEEQQSALRSQSSSFRTLSFLEVGTPAGTSALPFQPFLREEILVEIMKIDLPCTVQQFFSVLLSDASKFTEKYKAQRKDVDVKLDKWNPTVEYGGLIRKITFRSLCHSPMCPPDTAMTEWQHVSFSTDKRLLKLETVQQAHDVPFGSLFEVHARWTVQGTSESSSSVVVSVGTNFKKWILMQSKIKTGTEKEYKLEAELFIEIGRKFLEASRSAVPLEEINDEPQPGTPR